MAERQTYTPEERAALLEMFVASGAAVRAFCRTHKVAESTFRGWLTGRTDVDRALRAQQKAKLIELYDAEVRGIMDVLPGKRADASYRDLAVAVGILDDKITRASGEATDRHAVNGLVFNVYGAAPDA